MNYNIYINQFASNNYFPNLDIIDLAIFDYIKNFYPSSDKFTDDEGIWFWISHIKVIEDMPILKIKSKSGIIKRINNLIDNEILIRHKKSKELGKSYYKIGEKWNLLIKVYTSSHSSLGANDENQEIPHDENQENNNTNIDHNTNDHILWKKDFEIYKQELREVYRSLINDPSYISEQEKFNPGVDIKLTLEKACTNYWATEAGWKKKKSSKTKKLDWRHTLTNALSQPINRVYKQKKDDQKIAPIYQDLENYKPGKDR